MDIEKKTITVNKQAARVKSGGIKVLTPKTSTSIRVEPVPQEAIAPLIQKHEKHPDNPYMFPYPVTGGMYYPDTVSRLNTKILESAGLKHIRFHDLRHSYAVAAIKSGDDIKTVQGNLGHATASFTLDVYGHVTERMKRNSTDRMEALIQSFSH